MPAENAHVVDERLITKQGIAPSQLCEISAVMSAIGAANAINVRAGETVIVMPASEFFNSSAIVAVLGLGANVVTASSNPDTVQALISHFGNDEKFNTPVLLTGDVDKDSAALRAATSGGKGADAYLDFCSSGNTYIEAGLLALKRHGR